MIACTTPVGFAGHTPAKLNLFFEIHGKRPDGYHNVCSLCCPISVFDTLIVESQESPKIEFSFVHGRYTQTTQDIPTGVDNLVVKAVELVRKRYNVQSGCRVRLIKRIPTQAGMGGGSSNAAMAIRLVCMAWNLRLARDEMAALGAELGSDVPLFFFNELTLGHGRGEQIVPVVPAPRLDFVIVKPPEGISTAEAYRTCAAESMTDCRSPERLLKGLRSGNRREICSGMFNRFEKTARLLCPGIRQLRELFEKLDCPARQMTGSGTAYFALCHHQQHARQLASRLRLENMGEVFVAHTAKPAVVSYRKTTMEETNHGNHRC